MQSDWYCTHSCSGTNLASFPGLHAHLLSLAVRKEGRKPGRSRHMIRAVTDISASLLELIT